MVVASSILAQPAYTSPLQGVFYQPLIRDNALSPKQWSDLLRQVKDDGFSEVIFQWSKFGEVRFAGSDELIDRAIIHINQHELDWYLGLNMPLNYYQVMESKELNAKVSMLTKWLNETAILIRHLTIAGYPKIKGFKGWYIPMEISEPYMIGPLADIWQRGLEGIIDSTRHTVRLSYFPSAYSIKSGLKALSRRVNHPRLQLMAQISTGDFYANRRAVYKEIPCNIAIIHENYEQISENPFVAQKKTLSQIDINKTCHQHFVFSLRYLPYSKYLPLKDPPP